MVIAALAKHMLSFQGPTMRPIVLLQICPFWLRMELQQRQYRGDGMGAEETMCPNEQTGREDGCVDEFVSHLSNIVQMAVLCSKYSQDYGHFKHEYPDCIDI